MTINRMDKLNRVLFLVGVYCCLLFYPKLPHSAELNWYKMELIVFEQQSPTDEGFRQRNQSLEWPEDLKRLNSADGQRYASVAVGSGMASVFRKLERSPDHTPLSQLAWMQPVEKDKSGKAVRISREEVDGYIRLQRGTYLHLVVEMKYTPSSYGDITLPFEYSDNLFGETSTENYYIKERRRILLKEMHYFDHPKFGVIVQVSPLAVE